MLEIRAGFWSCSKIRNQETILVFVKFRLFALVLLQRSQSSLPLFYFLRCALLSSIVARGLTSIACRARLLIPLSFTKLKFSQRNGRHHSPLCPRWTRYSRRCSRHPLPNGQTSGNAGRFRRCNQFRQMLYSSDRGSVCVVRGRDNGRLTIAMRRWTWIRRSKGILFPARQQIRLRSRVSSKYRSVTHSFSFELTLTR